MSSGLPGIAALSLSRDQMANNLPAITISMDATRELTKCANGEFVSHEIVRDGIDALLQLKRASFDCGRCIQPPEQHPWKDELRTPPERPCVPCPPILGHILPLKDESDSDESSSDDDTPQPTIQRKRIRKEPVVSESLPPPQKQKPTMWHPRRKSSPPPQPTPKSPSPISMSSDDDATTPAVLHFSCLQCHRAKKRCNRTRPCTRCVLRGMEDECRYPDKHDPRSVLRACLRCWQTKKKCDRKQPSCGKCDKVGVKCVYRREQPDEVPLSRIY